MFIRVKSIEFDFEEIPSYERRDIVESTLSNVWEVDSEDDLVDAISDETGWLVKSIEI